MLADRDPLTTAVPVIAGTTELTGAVLVISDRSDAAVCVELPLESLAVTTTRRYLRSYDADATNPNRGYSSLQTGWISMLVAAFGSLSADV